MPGVGSSHTEPEVRYDNGGVGNLTSRPTTGSRSEVLVAATPALLQQVEESQSQGSSRTEPQKAPGPSKPTPNTF